MKITPYLIGGAFAGVAALVASQMRPAAPAQASAPVSAAPSPYQLPSDNFVANQGSVDAFAWQEFIALNWAASSYPGRPDTTQQFSSFGTPGDFGPGVWGTYKDVSEVFASTPPGPWQAGLQKLASQNVTKRFSMISKVDKRLQPGSRAGLLRSANLSAADKAQEEIIQAQGNWLTDQLGNLIWYEVRLNEDEFKYITTNKLYDADAQVAFAQKQGIWLPDGTNQYGPSGAVEVKAAWRVIPTAQLAQYQGRYKIVKGLIPQQVVVTASKTTFGDYQPAYLGLVGLHIIRKTPNFPQFTWATFEHVDLAPTEGQPVDPQTNYLLFNKNCPNQCGVNNPKGCLANQSPQPGVDSLTTPVQALRCKTGIPDDNAVAAVNQSYQQKIKAANPASVFQYYRLVSTQWPSSPASDPTGAAPRPTPLPTGGIKPTVLGNLASETYALQQGCMSCHQYGNSLAKSSTGKTLASDYSFVFGLAQKMSVPKSAPPKIKTRQPQVRPARVPRG
ncbi:hypothetical protein [Hymenobacter jeollabukensis]|uniref:Cytochrome c family protein n=1 Tax=Hymenobacter jeollabukensis TaxID=2025313 RepID=A0A5R8WJD2_9BACT|nr:hypothetical protein [Hymenobacter jeollabukensis]TLM89057.1 hypothetical protein FDY95_21035 [Hymenobacter jeollabukensis]